MTHSNRSDKQPNLSSLKRLGSIFHKITKNTNLYSQWDNSLNPRHLMWELYKEPISLLRDERVYSNRAMDYLTKHGQLIEEYIEIEDESQKEKDLNSGMPSFFDGTRQNKKILYKDNLVVATLSNEMTYSFEFFRPLSKPFIIKELENWILDRKTDSKVSVLIQRGGGLSTAKVSFTPPVIDDLEMNYGTGFKNVYDKIIEKLNERNGKVFIFSGDPGTGKSVLIKHLTSVVDREFIFVPVGLSGQISDPSFISLLLEKKEAVLVLEDAERAIQQRGSGNADDSAVANLLNISDGLLSSMLSISILVTFNAPKHTIDKALLRKGRLAYDYHFGPLSQEDAKKLAKHLNKNIEINGPMTLADIYGAGDDTGKDASQDIQDTKQHMGFHTLPQFSTPKQGNAQENQQKS